MKKKVKWVDNKLEGKINEQSLEVFEAESPTKEMIDLAVKKLILEGYTDVEAHAITGKSTSAYNEPMYTKPVFFDSLETIMKNKAARDIAAETKRKARALLPPGIDVPDNSNEFFLSNSILNAFSFFSSTTAMLTVSALATTAFVVKACR